MRARLIGGAQGRAQTVRQLGEIAVGDEGVAQSLLLLFGEGHEGRLANRARLDSPGDGEVRGERSLAIRGVGKSGDWSEAFEGGHVGRGLRVKPCAAHHQDDKA